MSQTPTVAELEAEIARLKVSNAEYERFFSVSLDMLCISSFDGHFKKVNPAFVATLGYTAEILCTKSYLDFIHPDDIQKTMEEIEKQQIKKAKVFSFENRYRHEDGTYRLLSWKSAPVEGLMYAAARDVTESKEAESELKKSREALMLANRELESFSYSVAHDLRAPLRSISGFISLALQDDQSVLTEDSRSGLSRVVAASKRMGQLIDSLLDLSRILRTQMNKSMVNLSTLATEIVEELKKTHPEQQASITICDGLMASGDAVLLRQVVQNLLGNAWKYSAKTGRETKVEFGVTMTAGVPTYFVRDNGAGFDMKYSDKLFGVFQRLHSDREFEGTGVGLATVQRIINRHEGKVWAEGEEGKGATFYFTLGA